MALDLSYRLQVAWLGDCFHLYLRSLLDGSLGAINQLELEYERSEAPLDTPRGEFMVTTYRLRPAELLTLFTSDAEPAPHGGDALWLVSVIRWVIEHFKTGAWYPERQDSKIHFRLLLDSAKSRRESHQLENAMPHSFLAALDLQEREPKRAWRELLILLSNTVGRDLITRDSFDFPRAALRKLPESYRNLLQELAQPDSASQAEVGFFDPRQANLTLKQRVSTLAFKIVTPTMPGESWQLRPQLQSITNPDLWVDALEAWTDPGIIRTELLPPSTSPRLHLLREFGRALRLFPVLGASLASSSPTALFYEDEEMAYFLSHSAENLRSYGYELLAPEGLRQASVPEACLQLSEEAKSGIDLHQLLDFQWDLVVNDTLLDPDLLAQWKENPSALFYDGRHWLWLDPAKTLKLLRLVEKQPRRGTLLEAMQFASEMSSLRLLFGGSLAPLGQSARFEEVPEPGQFQGELREYQRRGYSWLNFMHDLGLGACLADDMGLGKTVQTLAHLCSLKDQGELTPSLLVCPTSVMGNWQREAARFSPQLKFSLHHGERARNKQEFQHQVAASDVVVTSYPLLTRDQALFLSQSWKLIILDEAQQIKNPASKVSRLAAKFECAHRLILTGTPVENRLQDMWSLFRFIQPELLGPRRRFQARFAIPIERRGDDHVKRQLKRLVGPFILRRTKMDPQVAAELPSLVETTVECSLTEEQALLYQGEVDDALQALEGLEGFHRKGAIVRLLGRLKQLCDHPALLEDEPDWAAARSGKLHRLYEILKEVSPDEGVLIFSQFTRMLHRLKSHLTEFMGEEVLLLDGSTPREQRDEMVERFQSGIGPRLFCISLKAGGVGLNLTRAASVIHFDRWWNPAVESQATDRAHRIGQKKTVQVFKFVTLDTLEEQIARILRDKQALVSELIEEGDTWLTELNDLELSALLRPQTRAESEV